MIKEKIIGMLVCIFVLLLACSEPDEIDSVINSEIMGNDKVDVSLSLSSLPELNIDGNTDYRPMSTRSSGNNRSIIQNKYKCLVLKEIGNKWYVDSLVNRKLRYIEGERPYEDTPLEITENPEFNNLQLSLRPGHYRILVVLNPKLLKWNQNLVPGAVVKGETDTVAHAYTYHFQTSTGYPNYNKRQVNREIFAGTAEFTVKKTSDLYSGPVNGDTCIAFKRKVMQLRFMLKDKPIGDIYFSDTQHTIYATLVSTDPTKAFCDGLDCWGDPYYNHKTPTRSMEIVTQLDGAWRLAKNNIQYKIASYGVTVFSPFVFTDKSNTVPYQIEKLRISGQADLNANSYIYRSTIPNLELKDNSIQQIVFQVTNEVERLPEKHPLVTLEYLEEESKEILFDPYYECNIP